MGFWVCIFGEDSKCFVDYDTVASGRWVSPFHTKTTVSSIMKIEAIYCYKILASERCRNPGSKSMN